MSSKHDFSLFDKIENSKGALDFLPILHTCDGYSFREIIIDGFLDVNPCKVFNKEDLVYTFYGIPAYRIKSKKASENLAYFPVCFILDLEKCSLNPKRIFPFDSGAFHFFSDLKEKYFHDRIKLKNFNLNPIKATPKKTVDYFYNTNRNYLAKKPTINSEDIPKIEFELRGYTQLINDKTADRYDDRLSTIEISFDSKIELNSDVFSSIILPNGFLDDQRIIEILKNKYGVLNPIGYSTYDGMPNEFMSRIRSLYFEKFLKI